MRLGHGMRLNAARICCSVGLIGAAIVGFGYYYSRVVRVPCHLKLVDCTNAVLQAALRCPPGRAFGLVLAVPGVATLAETRQPEFKGQVTFEEGANVVSSLQITSETPREGFWLEKSQGLAAFHLTLPSTSAQRSLTGTLRPGASYRFKVNFAAQPPKQTSLWFVWQQSRKEVEQMP
jgi:hypothetical protein